LKRHRGNSVGIALDSYVFNHKQKQFKKAQAASRSLMMLRMEASAL
jgi:hypothetical protein